MAENDDTTQFNKPKWVKDCESGFKNNINLKDVEDIEKDLDNLMCNDIDAASVNDIVNHINDILKSAAIAVGCMKDNYTPTMKSKSIDKKVNGKPWFNQACKERRKQFFQSKAVYCKDKTYVNRYAKHANRNYKKEINKQHKLYFKDFANKFRNMKSKNPKDYWKIINESRGDKDKEINTINTNTFFEHLKKLSFSEEEDQNDYDYENFANNDDNAFFNSMFTAEEVRNGIHKLKNKACGLDLILNEFLKHSGDCMISVYVKLFNVILKFGHIPKDWAMSIILPIYKNKGPVTNPDNYRGITTLSCFCKLFNSILNNRLTECIGELGIMGEEQTGFRHDYSTMDHVFVLKNLIDLYLNKRKRLYCAFVDYRKAFDTVNRTFLWLKLLSNNIDGNIFTVIFNLYNEAKSLLRIHLQNICHLSSHAILEFDKANIFRH